MTEFGKKINTASALREFAQQLRLPEMFGPIDLSELILLLNELNASSLVRSAEIDVYYKAIRPKDRWEHPLRRVVAPHHLQQQELYFRCDLAVTVSRDIMRGVRIAESRGALSVSQVGVVALQRELIARRRRAAGELA